MALPAGYFLRPFTPDDYDGVIELGRVALDDMPMDAATLRRMDDRREPDEPWGRSVIVHHDSGQLRGMAQWGQHRGGEFCFFWIAVHPLYRGQGLGDALYKDMLAGCTPLRPESVHTFGLENNAQTLAFLKGRGFTEVARNQRSQLTLADFRPEQFTGALENLQAQGISIVALPEILGDSETHRRLYDTENAVSNDIPSPTPYVPLPFERWERNLQQKTLPQGYFIAVEQKSGAFVGVSVLTHMPGGSDLHVPLTGVLPEYRRRGIALALKVHAAQYAKSSGAPVIHTGNATTNTGMLAINERLGFQKLPARIRFMRPLR
ncbi:MAG: GNAT family N-acetyltransferase [Armatimonas sp.]